MSTPVPSQLQDGIYLERRDDRAAFLLATLRIHQGVRRPEASHAIGRVWQVLTELRNGGVMRDLTDTRPGEAPVTAPPGTFDGLLGFGASFFDPQRGLTEAPRPALLVSVADPGQPFPQLPWTSGDVTGRGEDDLCLQLTGRDQHAVGRAIVEAWKVIVDEQLPLTITGTFDGFGRDDGRSWIGFHDGVSNIEPSMRRAAVECRGDPDWNRGGTYLAFLRCAVDLAAWRRLTRTEQELLVGRDKLTGAGLRSVAMCDGTPVPTAFPLPAVDPEASGAFRDPPETGDPIVEASHVHRANQNRASATTVAGHRIYRQGYEYLDDLTATGPRLGLNFVSFQCELDHLRQILCLPSWLGDVNFGGRQERTPGEPPPILAVALDAAGLYAVPPQRGRFPGADLLAQNGGVQADTSA